MPLHLVVVPLMGYLHMMLGYLYNYSIGFGAGSAKGTTFWQGFLRPQEEKGTESNLQREI